MEPTYRIAQRLLASRAAVGVKQYGDDLTATSPGCMIKHALEEAADQVNYLLAEIQRRRDALLKIYAVIANLQRWHNSNLNREAEALMAVAESFGGESALAQYDEILGGGTVAENATVYPRDEALRVADEKPANSNCHRCEQVQQSLRETHAEFDAKMRDTVKLAHELGWNGVDNSKFMSVFLRDYFEQLSADNSQLREVLLLATSALESCKWNVTNHADGHQMQFQLCAEKARQALAAIRAAGGAR